MSKTVTTVKMASDGTLTRDSDGRRLVVDVPQPEKRTEAEIEAAAGADLENPPLTDEHLAGLARVPQIKTLRRALGLTQDEFARAFQIPIGTLRDWEQGRSQPDQPARAYLTVIAKEPDLVRRSLALAVRP